MLFIYGDYQVTWAVGGTGAPGPTALTDIAALNNGRTGAGCAFKWGGGTQTTASYVELIATIVAADQTTPRIGGVGLMNIRGLPAGTLVDVNLGAFTQRTLVGRRGELNAWIMLTSALSTATLRIRIYNNVNGAPSIPALTQFYIGAAIIGKLASWPLLLESQPQEELFDPTQYQRSSGGQLWQMMRKPYSTITVKLGNFVTVSAVGGTLSGVPSGVAGVTIDARTFMYQLALSPYFAVCAFPHKGPGNLPTTKTADGFYYDATMCNLNFMLARPVQLQPLSLSQPPYWGWGGQFQEAT